MKPSKNTPVLFFDFDNTITREDVLDRILERFSISEEWRHWEDAWVRGEISTLRCLDRQLAGIRASEAELIDFVASCQIDPHFAPIVQWAANARVELFVVSDNFSCLVREILTRHGLPHVPVMANGLTFSGNRLHAHFPFRSPTCERCAHCKAVHFRPFERCRKIYVGDGLSDVCIARDRGGLPPGRRVQDPSPERAGPHSNPHRESPGGFRPPRRLNDRRPTSPGPPGADLSRRSCSSRPSRIPSHSCSSLCGCAWPG